MSSHYWGLWAALTLGSFLYSLARAALTKKEVDISRVLEIAFFEFFTLLAANQFPDPNP